ncbi:3-hydroxy-3-methylglutaryl Coenzyme A reductase, hydroxymethylglutaryl-CoA reductase (NADP) [Methanocella conradii HZ254]|uniref:3-hydroxy-3-methylglutaryl coenzyme A reductase n=1 Tax=Methanocella conradii (strain DSM 24694 / JCM 17849 / CGMCC 1.5162 / HZ254) TaxID=1041930 RepID=H8I484_METCZ|nr:hydroxymethylglutaryl-CoA reductase (NADPH) [Methanocella conradii]AFC99223.1 3-hydroxy-3-methylglutaryl Coenzyme A reductase, hydroxymethylglutaryl-CoA reductase (NADP) [Methanocella conradii HZ254]MDI6897776.1 hydroxymethylglutaryl-CoA reductase (NADPH) [Methanocella conradii]
MNEDIVKKLVSGELKLHQADDNATSRREAVDLRREAISRLTHTDLSNIGKYSFDPEVATRKNVENAIGAVQVPLGIAGPLRINGDYARGDFYIPLATTEGALVASVNRGCSVCTQSGGVNVAVLQDEMTRAPVVKAGSLAEARRLAEAVKTPELMEEMRAAVRTTTRHGELLRVDPYVVGRSVFLRLAFDTKDAMGMNMATIASDAVMRLLEKKFDLRLVALSSNMCTDKKPAAINIIEGRGRTTVAEVLVPRKVVIERLKATPEDLCEVNYRKNFLGSARAVSFGFNAHVANVVAAMYIACGQDPAHVVEGSNAITSAELHDGDLLFTVSFPSLPLGTVGGGTGLATQSECLSLLGVRGGGDPPGSNARKLAEIVASASLAGELSLLGALASQDLARAHAKYGR